MDQSNYERRPSFNGKNNSKVQSKKKIGLTARKVKRKEKVEMIKVDKQIIREQKKKKRVANDTFIRTSAHIFDFNFLDDNNSFHTSNPNT